MEAQRTRDLLKRVRATYPRAFVYKVNDKTSSGIPDAVLSLDGEELWVEFKELRIVKEPTGEQVLKALTEIQKLTIRKMRNAGMNVVIVAFVGPKHFVFRYDEQFADSCYRIGFASLLELLGELWR